MHHQITLGDITIDRVVEQTGAWFDPMEFFPTLTREVLEEHRPWLEAGGFIEKGSGRIVLCVQSYVVRTKHHTILVDTCVGNHKPRPTRPFWNMLDSPAYEQRLAACGLRVEDIDYVMCTHLHGDHVGWNTRLDNGQWVPTFPNARYVFAEQELAHWTAAEKTNPESCPWVTDSVLPIVAAKRAEVVRNDHAIGDDVRLVSTPGHTVDHCSLHVGKAGRDAFITGDMVHSGLQIIYPEMGMRVDYDAKLGGMTRRRIFNELSDTPTLLCAAHFPSPSVGRLTRAGDAFRFAFI